jgi:hypothetical protein
LRSGPTRTMCQIPRDLQPRVRTSTIPTLILPRRYRKEPDLWLQRPKQGHYRSPRRIRHRPCAPLPRWIVPPQRRSRIVVVRRGGPLAVALGHGSARRWLATLERGRKPAVRLLLKLRWRNMAERLQQPLVIEAPHRIFRRARLRECGLGGHVAAIQTFPHSISG